ncbi:MAG: sigma-70 family RNA polymerase sigma factor, partial [Planctomycetes bacterium]|nr:sigma-70 family RNA polymerase sigma factor [Planctomycetota bacterium]
MSTAPTEFAQLMQRVKAGSNQAARELLDRYGDHILRAIRRRLGRRMRSQFDSVDFLQATLASFCAHPSWLSRFDRPDALIKFLARVATNKVI